MYCGSGAGFLKDYHPECKQKNVDGWVEMVALAGDAVVRGENVDSLPDKLAEVARASYIPESQCVPAIVAGWGQALDRFLDDSLLSESEYARLVGVADRLGITYEELNVNGAYDRAEKAKILTDLSQGEIPTQDIKGELPLNLKKSEEVVYLFGSVSYWEERTQRSYVGGSHGVGIRVMKGVYYRVGAFKGRPVTTSQMENLDTGGLLVVTTENLYYHGHRKSFRIPYSKIVSFTHYSDGIGLHRDTATARPQVFVTGDGWFTCNLIESVARMAEG
jgi:hypothetical protein